VPSRCLAVLLLLASAPACAQQHYVELRAAGWDAGLYRYAEYSYTRKRLVFDAVYLGIPGQNELYTGLGYQWRPGAFTLTPLLYNVIGKENHQWGLAAGAFITAATDKWNLYCFSGYFEPLRGDVKRYFFVDTIDVVRDVDRGWGLGVSTGTFQADGFSSWLVGPVLSRTDSRGTWKLSVRGGSNAEVRLTRTLSF